MVKRKKRLTRSIASLEQQIASHKEKEKQAHDDGDEYLERYYEKEVEALEKRKVDREDKV